MWKAPESKEEIDDNSNGVDSTSQTSVSSLPKNDVTEMQQSTLQRRPHENSVDRNTRESSPSSELSVRLRPSSIEQGMRDRLSVNRSKDKSLLLRERDTREPAKRRHLHERSEGGTASSSASTCSEDSEMRVNDFLGKHWALIMNAKLLKY